MTSSKTKISCPHSYTFFLRIPRSGSCTTYFFQTYSPLEEVKELCQSIKTQFALFSFFSATQIQTIRQMRPYIFFRLLNSSHFSPPASDPIMTRQEGNSAGLERRGCHMELRGNKQLKCGGLFFPVFVPSVRANIRSCTVSCTLKERTGIKQTS